MAKPKRCQAKNPAQCKSPRCPARQGSLNAGSIPVSNSPMQNPNRVVNVPNSIASPSSIGRNQKGASGIIAEYACALHLQHTLINDGFNCINSMKDAKEQLKSAIRRVGDSLDNSSILRSNAQGKHLSDHIVNALKNNPTLLKSRLTPKQIKESEISIVAIGSNTNSGNSADLLITIRNINTFEEVPISLKAYAREIVSLGSKGGLSSLKRMFDESTLGESGAAWEAHMEDFKGVTKTFYEESPEGKEFIKHYLTKSSKSVINNRFRRKELGHFYHTQKGYTSASIFASNYARIFNERFAALQSLPIDSAERLRFTEGFRFALGMEKKITTISVIDDGEKSFKVINSNVDEVYGKLNKAIANGAKINLKHVPGTGSIKVAIQDGDSAVEGLSLNVWQDGTVQFKLDTRRNNG